MLFLQAVVFTSVLWLGFYLVDREPENPLTRNAGLGAVTYSLVLALNTTARYTAFPDWLLRAGWALMPLPPVFWTGAIIHLPGFDEARKERLGRLWARWLLPTAVAILLLTLLAPGMWSSYLTRPTSAGIIVLAVWSMLPLAASLCVLPVLWAKRAPRGATGAAIAAALFFALGMGLLILPDPPLDAPWILVAIALDFELIGLAIAWLDAFDLGETLWRDFLRSAIIAAILAALFGGQIALVITLSTGPTAAMVSLLHLTILAALLVASFLDRFQSYTEKRLVGSNPPEYFELRATQRAAGRIHPRLDPAALDDEAFFRFTRRALSQYGNLPRLTSNPLIHLPAVSSLLEEKGLSDTPLERAQLLKQLLADAVMRLKPDTENAFDDTPEWRYYNALYFPYILGLRPYSRQFDTSALSPEQKEALAWFRREVPERTLHNWQTAAARLVASHLRSTTHAAT